MLNLILVLAIPWGGVVGIDPSRNESSTCWARLNIPSVQESTDIFFGALLSQEMNPASKTHLETIGSLLHSNLCQELLCLSGDPGRSTSLCDKLSDVIQRLGGGTATLWKSQNNRELCWSLDFEFLGDPLELSAIVSPLSKMLSGDEMLIDVLASDDWTCRWIQGESSATLFALKFHKGRLTATYGSDESPAHIPSTVHDTAPSLVLSREALMGGLFSSDVIEGFRTWRTLAGLAEVPKGTLEILWHRDGSEINESWRFLEATQYTATDQRPVSNPTQGALMSGTWNMGPRAIHRLLDNTDTRLAALFSPVIESIKSPVSAYVFPPRDPRLDINPELVLRFSLSDPDATKRHLDSIDLSSFGIERETLKWSGQSIRAWVIRHHDSGLLPCARFVNDSLWVSTSPAALMRVDPSEPTPDGWHFDNPSLFVWFRDHVRARLVDHFEEVDLTLSSGKSPWWAREWGISERNLGRGVGKLFPGGASFRSETGGPLNSWLLPTALVMLGERMSVEWERELIGLKTRSAWDRLSRVHDGLKEFKSIEGRWPVDLGELLARELVVPEDLLDPSDPNPSLIYTVNEGGSSDFVPTSYRYLSPHERRGNARRIILFSAKPVRLGRLVLFEDGRVGVYSEARLKKEIASL